MDNNPQELEKLTKSSDLFKGLLIGACILWLCVIIAAIYFYTKKGNIALFIPAFTMIIAFLPVYLRLKSLNKEIKSKR